MKKIVSVLVISLALFSFQTVSSNAATSKLSLTVLQTPGGDEPVVTLYGNLKPAKSSVKVEIQIQLNGKWQDTRFSTRTARVGTWKVVAVATALNAQVKYHPNGAPIDFVKKYSAGMRFVMIKASDTRDEADALALKYVIMDRLAAQAAGMYTGFYHYAVLPDVRTDAEVVSDAQTQAQKVIWRLEALGGYNDRDLPYALDLENNCVRLSGKTCARYLPKAQITLWAKTFLKVLREKTDRMPILYSYPSFLEGAMVRDDELRQYPLWLAQYGIDPADPLGQPGLKEGGCYVHSWTAANCSSQWIIWQYSSCGIAPKYGVPGTRLDLNVFRGEPSAFLDLVKGSWFPEVVDQMPKNETSTLVYKNVKFSNSDKPVTLEVDVTRPDGKPVVTGTVRFYTNSDNPIEPKPVQTVVRSTSGSWKLTIKGIPAGTWTGRIGFKDATGTHAESRSPITLSILPGDPNLPTPTPKPTVAPTKKPTTDGCRNQIKN